MTKNDPEYQRNYMRWSRNYKDAMTWQEYNKKLKNDSLPKTSQVKKKSRKEKTGSIPGQKPKITGQKTIYKFSKADIAEMLRLWAKLEKHGFLKRNERDFIRDFILKSNEY